MSRRLPSQPTFRLALVALAAFSAGCPFRRGAPTDAGAYDGPARDPDERRVPLVLYDIWGSGVGDAWAVGDNGVIVHWDGTAWHVLRYRAPAHLYGVWGARADDVWAVGAAGLAVHWDGTRWTPAQSGTRANLRAVWGANGAEVWAAGEAGTIVRWRGGPAVSAELVASASATTLADAPPSDRDAAPSDRDAAPSDRDAAASASASAPTAVARVTDANLDDVTGTAANDVWFVGEAGTILRWNGATFARVPSGTSAALHGAWFANASDGWIVGAPDEASDGPIAEALALHWDGARLTPVRTGTREPLEAVWGAAPNDVWAVGHNFGRGYDGPRRQIVRWDGNGWAPRSWGASGWYAGVWGAGAGDVWAVGCCESILQWSPNGWTAMTTSSRLAPPPSPPPVGSSFRRARQQPR